MEINNMIKQDVKDKDEYIEKLEKEILRFIIDVIPEKNNRILELEKLVMDLKKGDDWHEVVGRCKDLTTGKVKGFPLYWIAHYGEEE